MTTNNQLAEPVAERALAEHLLRLAKVGYGYDINEKDREALIAAASRLAALASPASISGDGSGAKPLISEEWLNKHVAKEGDADPTTGDPTTAMKWADMERLAFEALPTWAQNEITRLRAALATAPEGKGRGEVSAAIKVKPLDWYEPTDHIQDDADNSILVAHGIGGRYHISRRQLVRIPSPDNMGYLLWGHPDGDEFSFTEHLTIDDAKTAAQIDFEQRILACLTGSSNP